MPQTVAELLEAALTLTEADRVELMESIAATLPSPPGRLHPAWTAELRRRAAEIDSGQVLPIPWDDVRRQVREQLDAGEPPNG